MDEKKTKELVVGDIVVFSKRHLADPDRKVAKRSLSDGSPIQFGTPALVMHVSHSGGPARAWIAILDVYVAGQLLPVRSYEVERADGAEHIQKPYSVQ